MNKKIELKKLSKFRIDVIFMHIIEVLGFIKQTGKENENDDCRNIK